MHPDILTIGQQRHEIAAIADRFDELKKADSFLRWRSEPHAICYYGSTPYAALVRIKGLADAADTFKIPFLIVFHGGETAFKDITRKYRNLVLIATNPERLPAIAPVFDASACKVAIYCRYYDDAPLKDLMMRDEEKSAVRSYSSRISVALSEFSFEGNKRYARGYVRDAGIPVMTFPWAVNINAHIPVPPQQTTSKVIFIGTYYEKAPRLEAWFNRVLHTYESTIIGPDWSRSTFPGIPDRAIPPGDFDTLAPSLYSSNTVAVNLHHGFEESGYTCNERTFNSTACGGFQISDRVARIDEFFDGTEIVTAATPNEYFEKIRWYIEHPDERQPFLVRALRKIYGHHTYHHRLIDLLSVLFSGKPVSEFCPVLNEADR